MSIFNFLNLSIMSNKNNDLQKGLEVTQLEERLEMVQVSGTDAAAESFALDSPTGGIQEARA